MEHTNLVLSAGFKRTVELAHLTDDGTDFTGEMDFFLKFLLYVLLYQASN